MSKDAHVMWNDVAKGAPSVHHEEGSVTEEGRPEPSNESDGTMGVQTPAALVVMRGMLITSPPERVNSNAIGQAPLSAA